MNDFNATTCTETLAPLPTGWDDERNDDSLWGVVSRALIDEAPSLSPHTVKKRRLDWGVLRQALEPAGVNTVEDWNDPHGRQRAFDALRVAGSSGLLGKTVTTLDTRLSSLRWGLKMAGLSPEVLQRVKSACRQVCRQSGIVHSEQPVYGAEHAQALLNILSEWQSRPLVMNKARNTVHDGVTLYKGYAAQPWRLAQLRTFVMIQISYGIRFGDVMNLKRDDVDENEIRWSISKGRRYPEPASAEMMPTVWNALTDWFEYQEGESLFRSHERSLHGDIKALCVAAELPALVGGQHGLHRFRAGIASNAHRVGLPSSDAAAALGHVSSATTERHYTDSSARNAGRHRTLDAWREEALPTILSRDFGGSIDVDGIVNLDVPIMGPDGCQYSILYPLISTGWFTLNELGDFEPYRDILASENMSPDSRLRCVCLSSAPIGRGGGIFISGYIEIDGGLVAMGNGVRLSRGKWTRSDLNRGLTPNENEPLVDSIAATASEVLASGNPRAIREYLRLLASMGGGSSTD